MYIYRLRSVVFGKAVIIYSKQWNVRRIVHKENYLWREMKAQAATLSSAFVLKALRDDIG